jgi:parallel beta-helix repeat protein
VRNILYYICNISWSVNNNNMKRFYIFFILAISFLSIQTFSQTTINSGNVSGTWTSANSPYNINGDITVPFGSTLTINPGVVVNFNGHYKLNVQGKLIAQGNSSSKIKFTASSSKTGWKGIRFDNTSSKNDTCIIEHCIIEYGKASAGTSEDKMGGGIFVKGFSKLIIRNNIISNNYAYYYGGGICTRYGANPIIINNVICNNTANSGGGGFYCFYNSNPYLINNTIANNSASYSRGGVYANGTSPKLYNCIVYGNSPSSQQIYPSNLSTVINCNIEGGYSGRSIINDNPDFISPSSGAGTNFYGTTANWGIADTSPCIDHGVIPTGFEIPDYDVAGTIRIDPEIIDIGALENLQSIVGCGTISQNTTWSESVVVTCDVSIASGRTLTIMPGTKVKFLGNYMIDVDGTLLAQGNLDSFITFTAWKHNIGWAGIRFDNTSSSNDSSKIEYSILEYARATRNTGLMKYGGAVYTYNFSKLLIRSNFFSNNYAVYYGGAMFIYNNSDIKIINNVFVNNESGSYGGAISLYSSSDALMVNNTIMNNKANSTRGGGLYVSSCAPTLTNNIIFGNESTSSGLEEQVYPTNLSNVTYNDIGGGLYSGTGNVNTNPKISFPTGGAGLNYYGMSGNWSLQETSTLINAGISSTSGLDLPATDLTGKQRVFGTVDIGAFEDISTLNASCNITSNTTWNARRVLVNCDVTVSNGATLTIAPGTKVIFQSNRIINVLGNVVAEGTEQDTIFFTTVTGVKWSGLRINNPSNSNDSSKFVHCLFENAEPVSSSYIYGGAMYIYSFDKVLINKCTFRNNNSYSSGYGGALSVRYSDPIITDNVFISNYGYYGGALYFVYAGGIFSGNILKDNSCYHYGGAAYLVSGGTRFLNNKFINNTSQYYGGAVVFSSLCAFDFSNNLVANNQARYGGAFFMYSDIQTRLNNNTIVNNHASINGGAFYLNTNSDPTIKNSIIYGNTNASGNNNFYLVDVSSSPKLYNSIVEEGMQSFDGNTFNGVYSLTRDVNPQFVSPSGGSGTSYNGLSANFNIQTGSPAINVGTDDTLGLNLFSYDLNNNLRVYNGRIDIGAFENQQDIVVCGNINRNTIWDADTIKVNCDITINDSFTLTITAGTYVEFQSYYEIDVKGRLIVDGNSDDPVIFAPDDTSGFYDNSDNSGGWGGLKFNTINSNNDTSKICFAILRNAKNITTSYYSNYGSALYVYNFSKLRVENSQFVNNKCGYKGGAIYVESGNPIFYNNIIANNEIQNTNHSYSSLGYGGGICLDDANINFNNNTVVNNASPYGGGIYCWASSPTMKNNILYGNISTYSTYYYYGPQLYVYQGSNPTVDNIILQGGQNKIGGSRNSGTFTDVYDVDPEFISPSGGQGAEYDGLLANWEVANTSVAVNNGTPFIPSSQLTLTDINGNERTVADTIDIGAYEIQISPKFIVTQPTSQTTCLNSTATFTSRISLNANYQWQKDGVNIQGANSRTLLLSNISLIDTGKYYCIISNAFGSVSTDSVDLFVDLPPTITTPPAGTAKCVGQSVTFSVSATGTQPLTYQWYSTNGLIAGATNSTYTINSVSQNDQSSYYCIVTNNCGAATSNGATLTINTEPSVAPIQSAATICEQNSYPISTTASGTSPISYQWVFNNSEITGANGSSYTVTSASTSDDGFYYCRATNLCGADSTNSLDLTVDEEAQIVSQTSSTSVCEGQSMTFSVTATGTAPLSYQWYNSQGQIAGASNNTYTINSVDTTDADNYYCIVTNSCGSDQSNQITLTVNKAPYISAQSSNTSACVGSSPSFSITAYGTNPITYQWYKSSGRITSATNNQLTLSSITTNDATAYYCVATNVCGTAQSNNMQLTVNEAPDITSQTSNTTKCEGQSMTFSVSASGTSPLSYQWYSSSGAITGATNNTYTITSVDTTDADAYYCIVTNTCGNDQSNNITLTVNQSPTISAQSSSTTACVNSSASFSITAYGTNPITYQWYKSSGSISSATNNILSLNSLSTSDANTYYCIATNSCGTATSNNMTLTVNEPPTITSQTGNITKCEGQSMTFSVSATGTLPFTYQWYNSSGSITGATSSTYTINSLSTSDASTYYCIVTNSCGNDQSNNISLSVSVSPTITAQSGNATRCEGQSQTFSVTATGSGTLTYQWYNAYGAIQNATNNTYTINAVSTSDAGNYYCIVSNNCGSVQSSTKILTVEQAPVITSITPNRTRCEGQSITLSVSTTGTNPISYQWYDPQNSSISGATNSFLSLNSLTTNDAGNYYCIATNTCGSDQSNNSQLTVNTPPEITSVSQDATKCAGSSVTFSVSASGTNPITYQWYGKSSKINNAKNNSYTINSTDTTVAGYYYCIAKNSCGTDQSSNISLTINTKPKVVAVQDSVTACAGTNEIFNVNASSNLNMTYSWYQNAIKIAGAENNFYLLSDINVADGGTYYCKVSNACGSTDGDNIYLSVVEPVRIISESGDSSKCEGQEVSFDVQAIGDGSLDYQWYNLTGKIDTAISSQLSFSNLDQSSQGVYYCEISNYCGTEKSTNKTLTVHQNPSVNIGSDTTFCYGGAIYLTPGSGYFCKWSTGSINPQILVDESGEYYVHVTDIYGCEANSDTVNVNVLMPYNDEEICLVTVDEYTSKNLVAWERTSGQNISYYNVYRETTASGIYEKLGSVPFDSISVFVDYYSNPKQRAYRYRITAVDSCGNESDPSRHHKTIHLSVNQGVNDQNNLIWSHYEGFPFQTYKIYRGTHPDSMTLLDSIQSNLNSYTDITPPKGATFYQVIVVKNDTCYPTVVRAVTTSGPFSQSMSNIKDFSASEADYLTIHPTSQEIDSNYGSSFTFEIYTNMDNFKAKTSASWLAVTADVENKTVEATALSDNPYAHARYARILIESDGVPTQYAELYQLGTEGTSDIIEYSENNVLQIYPNPFRESTRIIIPEADNSNKILQVFDMQGKLVREIRNIQTNVYELDAKGLTKGMYQIRVVGQKVYTGKVILE